MYKDTNNSYINIKKLSVMKKLLLFVCAAVTAISANAQTTVIGKSFTVEQLRENTVNKVLATTNTNETINKKNVIAAAPELNKLSGNYIEASYNEIYDCSEATVTTAGENVAFSISGGSASFTGTYDATSGLITVKEQNAGTYTDTRGTFTFEFVGLQENATTGNINIVNQATFTASDEGEISCNQIGYAIAITNFVPAEGSDYTKEDLVGKWWTLSWETRFMPINGVQSCTANLFNEGYKKHTFPISIEDYEYSVNVYGFCGLGCISLDIDDNLNVSISAGQPIYNNTNVKTEEDIATYGPYYYIVACNIENGYLIPDYDKVVPGKLSGNTITLSEYFLLRSKNDAEDKGYSLGAVADKASTITLNTGNFLAAGTTGIEEIGITREEKIKNTKTYNLMGQQVNRATAKGLLIRDGKKYIKKN